MTVGVSVILPTFNRTHSLAAAISSVLNQSYKDLELLVVDDGSSEDVEAVVRDFDDGRVKYIRREKNGGAAIRAWVKLKVITLPFRTAMIFGCPISSKGSWRYSRQSRVMWGW
jgi:cellulose synthase/poly-beta-1,6-N-acetylglucosamine synthase-like glycosyltransferase